MLITLQTGPKPFKLMLVAVLESIGWDGYLEVGEAESEEVDRQGAYHNADERTGWDGHDEGADEAAAAAVGRVVDVAGVDQRRRHASLGLGDV